MSTKVSIIEIMRAFSRWNPLDVKQLFAEELAKEVAEEVAAKERQIKTLSTQLNSILIKGNCLQEMNEKNMKIVLLENEIKSIRNTNRKLYTEGLELINDLKNKVNRLEKQLNECTDQLRRTESRNEDLVKTNANLNKQNIDLNNKLGLSSGLALASTSTQSLKSADNYCEPNGRNRSEVALRVRQKFNEIIESNRQYSSRLKQSFEKLIALRDENLKLKQQLKQKICFIQELENNKQNDNHFDAIVSTNAQIDPNLENLNQNSTNGCESEDNLNNNFDDIEDFEQYFDDMSTQIAAQDNGSIASD